MAAMTWVQRLKRVFNMDIEACGECGYPRGSGRVSFGQIAGIGPAGGVKGWRVSRPGWRHSGLDSDTWTGGYSINVDFSEKGFYFSAPPDRLCHTIFLPSNYPALCYLPLALQPSSPHAKVEARESGR